MLCYGKKKKGGGGMKGGRALACFDFDGTMIRGDSIVAYLRFAYGWGALSRKEYAAAGGHTAAYFLGLETGDQVKTHALRFWGRLSPAEREKLDAAFARETLLPRIYPQAKQCWEEHRAAGRIMLLVSASTDNYMRFVAEALQADALLCTRLLPNGSVTGNCRGEEKVRRIRAWIEEEAVDADLGASFAYGDSAGDLPMLALTGHPTQVNPKKRLEKAAPDMKKVNWG